MKVAFVCHGNTCRSQIALGIAQKFYPNVGSFYSAGVKPGYEVASNAVKVLKEWDIALSIVNAKGVESLPKDVELYIIMGNDVAYRPSNKRVIQLNIQDPIGCSYSFYCETRDEIRRCLAHIFENESMEG